MGRFNKLYVALAGLLAAGSAALADGVVDGNDFMVIAIAAVTAAGVYFAPNSPPAV